LSSDGIDRPRAFAAVTRLLHGIVDDRLGGREPWVGMVLLGGVLQEQLGEPFLAGRRARRQDRPLQRADRAPHLRRLLRIDLDAERNETLVEGVTDVIP
jgi:hypothetical protein